MPSITMTRLSPDKARRPVAFKQAVVSLGSDPDSDFVIRPDAGATVAERHVEVEYRGGAWWAKDVSPAGTFLDGRRIRWERLQPGTVLELGRGGPRVLVDFVAGATRPPMKLGSAEAESRPPAPPHPPATTPEAKPVPPRPDQPAPAQAGRWPLLLLALLALALASALWLRRS